MVERGRKSKKLSAVENGKIHIFCSDVNTSSTRQLLSAESRQALVNFDDYCRSPNKNPQ